MTKIKLSRGELFKLVFSRLIIIIPLMFAMFFLPAGTWNYWQAWMYLATLFTPMIFVILYLIKKDPDLLERRMKFGEKQREQKKIINLSIIYYLLTFALPGFDHRFGWSNVPVAVAIAADILVAIGYGIVILVFRENSYASRIVEVSQEQKVISSGPYAVVRHPMYVGVTLMYGLSPLALGSYWAIIPALSIIPILVARIINEEKMLREELKGYNEYMQKTKYRLIPGIW
jgi:protein-S-isoprenylcysteine O-methyltransferase Ste14